MLTESESQSEVRKTGHRVADLAIAFSALLISLCSLGLAIHSGHAMDRLVQANSMPFLEFMDSNVDPRTVGDPNPVHLLQYAIVNPGAGGARIERLTIEVDHRAVKDWDEALNLIQDKAVADGQLPPNPARIHVVSSSFTSLYLRAGAEQAIVWWRRTEENAQAWDVINKARNSGRFRLTACYCSIFDQCWLADSDVFRPKPVEKCEAVSRPAS